MSRSCRAQLLPTDAERLGRSHRPFRHSPASSGRHTGHGSRCFLPGLGGRWSQKLLPGGWWPVALEPDRKGSTCADLGLSSPTCWGRSLIQADQQPLICLLGSKAAGDSPRSACDCFTSHTNPSICVERSWWQRMRFPGPHPSSAYTKGGAAGTGCVSISRMVDAEPASEQQIVQPRTQMMSAKDCKQVGLEADQLSQLSCSWLAAAPGAAAC